MCGEGALYSPRSTVWREIRAPPPKGPGGLCLLKPLEAGASYPKQLAVAEVGRVVRDVVRAGLCQGPGS